MSEGVQFAHMKFCGEKESVNAGALEIGGESMEFAASIGEVAVAEFGSDDAAAFDADLQALQFGSSAAKSVVSLIEAVENARMGRVVETRGAQEKLEI